MCPDATEVCDGVDNDCDGAIDDEDDSVDASTGIAFARDNDGDGSPGDTEWACVPPEGSGNPGDTPDCDDSDPAVNPGAVEVCGNGIDDDCDDAGIGCGLTSGTEADADVTYTGVENDGTGVSVAIGDYDGDGGTDLAVGAYDADTIGYNAGEVRIYTSNDTGTVPASSAWATISDTSDDDPHTPPSVGAWHSSATGTPTARTSSSSGASAP